MATAKISSKATNIALLNNIRKNQSLSYQERIPVATQENYAQLTKALTSREYQAEMNIVANELVNRIGYVFMQNRAKWENPLKALKKGMVSYGTDIEEIYVGLAKAHTFNPSEAETNVFKTEYTDVKALYHRLNRQDYYKVTVKREQLRQAFINENGLADLISQLVESLYRGAEQDEYLLTRQLLQYGWEHNYLYPIIVENPIDEKTTKDVIEKVRATSSLLTFNSTEYNEMGVPTYTRRDKQVLFMNPYFEAKVDVNVLAQAFNMDKAEFLSRVIIVDTLGNEEVMKNVVCILADEDFFMIWDNLFETGSLYNPEGLYWNNWLQVWQTYSLSRFCNAVAFVTEPTITSVSITPTTASLKKGQSLEFTTSVTGDYSNNVIMSLTGNTSEKTFLLGKTLQVGDDETATALTVKATSFYDDTKNASATITVSA